MDIQSALYDMWFKHYATASDKERVNLVEQFIDKYLSGLDPDKVIANHPASYHRENSDDKRRSVAIILADFIIRAEDDDSDMTLSPQTAVNRKHSRNEREVYVDFTDTYDDESAAENRQAGVITEYDIQRSNPSLYSDFTEVIEDELSVDDFRAMIENVKASPEKYAGIYSEKYRKDYNETLRRIKKLDIKRIAICDECGGVFYRHDMRRKYCDLQGDGKPTCEVNAKRRRESERYSDKRSEKVKDRADTLHYIIEGRIREPIFYGS